MQLEGLRARVRKRFQCTTMSEHDQPVAANVLDRDFIADAPNQRWVADTTEFVIGSSGKFYLAAVLDLYSRFLVGWAVSAVNDRHLVIKALKMALKRRRPPLGLLHHSDQGSPYASEDYQAILVAHGMLGSMSRRGDCLDNAVMESWFSTVKHELGERFESCGQAKMELFDYIEVFYNQRRRHSTLGQMLHEGRELLSTRWRLLRQLRMRTSPREPSSLRVYPNDELHIVLWERDLFVDDRCFSTIVALDRATLEEGFLDIAEVLTLRLTPAQ